MTFEEAKKIFEKEGFYLIKFGGPSDIIDDPFSEYESPEVYEARDVVNSAGYGVGMHSEVSNERKARLKKEYKENTKSPGPGVNPAIAESASQFNDALLDAQAKKIKRLGKEIAKLNSIIHDKNAVLADVAEELRLTKIREKNLAELGLKYVGENEKLKKKLADKTVDEIDARALKSAESALAYKEKVIAEKDDVIADLGKELAAQKDLVDDISLKYDGAKYNLKLRMDECEKLKKQLDSNTKMVQKMSEIIVHKKPVTADVFKKCCIMAYNEEKLSKVLDDAIDQFLLFGEIIIKSEK